MPPRQACASAAAIVSLAVLSAPVRAQDTAGALGTVPLPGGLHAALAVLDDPVPASHADFLLELIRRTHGHRGARRDRLDATLAPFLDHLERAVRESEAAGPSEMLPLPLRLDAWNTSVFQTAVAPESFVRTLVRSRNASLLYAGLLSLDDRTRAWLEGEPVLLAEIAAHHAPAFLLASPGLRVADSTLIVPGGKVAEATWQALVGHRPGEPAAFIRSLLVQGGGRLAYFFGEMARLSPRQLDVLLDLSAGEEAARVSSARRLYALYERLTSDWRLEERTFWRPRFDPGTLIAELRTGDRGEPLIPGTRRFWLSVFAGLQRSRHPEGSASEIASSDRPEFLWLAEQVFNTEAEQERRYHMVLFASRLVTDLTPQVSSDALDATLGAAMYPALIASLERAGLTDLAAFGAAVRRASRLAAIRDEARAVRALTQFQAALSVLLRAASRGSIASVNLPALVSSLSAVELTDRGDYEGGIVVWLDAHLRGTAAAAVPSADSSASSENGDEVDAHLVRLVAGPSDSSARLVDWEGTRYRVDFRHAESLRIRGLLEPEADASLSSAHTLVRIADIVSAPALTPEVLAREAAALEAVAGAIGIDGSRWTKTDVRSRLRDAARTLQQAERGRRIRDAGRVVSLLRQLADDLLARGLLELVYVAAIGHPDVTSASTGEIAARHDFGLRVPVVGRLRAWQLPASAAESPEGRRVIGALLGLDLALAEFALRRVTWKPPSRRPSVDPESRRVFLETVALVEPDELTDSDQRAIATAIRRGRERMTQAATAQDALRLADDAGLSAARRGLLAWTASHRRDQLETFLSTRELFWLGYGGEPLGRLDSWGVASGPRSGCLCRHVFGRRPWETLAGRWHGGVLATAVPDLNLRLAELLDELEMPASLLGPVVAAATTDFLNSVESRDRDDYRGLTASVQNLTANRVEDYLALLTTGGPLLPVSGSTVQSHPEGSR